MNLCLERNDEGMENVIVAAILFIIVGAAVVYIIKEKKKGTVCIGCPHAGSCASKKDGNSQCNCK